MSQNYDFLPMTLNDTFDGVVFNVVINGSSLNLTGGSVSLFLYDPLGTIEYSTVNGKMLISTPPTSGSVEFIKQIITTYSLGTIPYEIIFKLANGDIRTYVSGTWTITRS